MCIGQWPSLKCSDLAYFFPLNSLYRYSIIALPNIFEPPVYPANFMGCLFND